MIFVWEAAYRRLILQERNLALQDSLYKLREETKAAFDEAKALYARWAELQREQREVYQVCLIAISLPSDTILTCDTALQPSVPPDAPQTRNYCTG